jgi:hypothetical protein
MSVTEETPDFVGVATRLRRPFVTHLRQIAQDEHRSLSNLIAMLLAEAVEARDGITFETRPMKPGRKGGDE